MEGKIHNSLNSNHIFSIGLILFFLLNIITASFLEVHYDEAYYWIYSQNLSLGYFDHPPMVAWMIAAGESLFNNQLGLRLLTVLFSTFSFYVLWLLAKKHTSNALLFWAVVFSTLLVHPYSFIASPDAPLFLFTSLFLFFYDRYLKNESWMYIIALSISIAGLIYSKYHGFLVIGFVVLSNLKLFSKRSFWMIFLLSALLLIPHLLWQYQNHFPSFQYHLVDSHNTAYRFELTLNYILSALAITGPWLGWFFLYTMWKNRSGGKFGQGLKVLGIGTFVFFLLSTFGGDFEAHWTLIAFPPLILIAVQFVEKNEKWKKWIYISGIINFGLFLLVRILLITPLGDDIKVLGTFKGWKNDSIELKNKIGDIPVLFQDSWNRAARFAYYNQDDGVGNLNSGLYRKNQFDLLDKDEDLWGKSVCIISTDSTQFESCEKIKTRKATWYVKRVDAFHSYYNLKFEKISPFRFENNRLFCPVTIENPYEQELRIGNSAFELYRHQGKDWLLIQSVKQDSIRIGRGEVHQKLVAFNLSREEYERDEIYLTFKIGVLKPIPGRLRIRED